MGRLFWKFFIFIWLAQMAGIVAVGTTFWLRHQTDEKRLQQLEATAQGAKPQADRIHRPHPRRFPVEPLIATLFASLICAALLARYFSKPIRHLRNAFDATAAGDLQVRIGATMGSRRDELADLGQDFDRMADQLSRLVEAQRRLLHDVSHELRSPLARLQVAVGLARQQPEKRDAMMSRIEQETVRIDAMVGELLTLSRMEAGDTPGGKALFSVAELLREVFEDASFEAEANGQYVKLQVECEAGVVGRQEMLRQAIENVVRNALKHTPAGKEITLSASLTAQGDGVVVTVSDQGPGAPEDELETMFEPFFRGSGAKSNDGYGLGLAIARRAVLALGGEIHAVNCSGGGLRVEMQLPLVISK